VDDTKDTARILIVDDDLDLGSVLDALLRQAGFSTCLVTSGEAALEAVEQHGFDAILSDVRMPGMDGLELLKRLTGHKPSLPVVLLTAHGTVPLAVEAMKCGAADYLQKPFDRNEIIFVMRKVLAAGEQAGATSPPLPTGGLLGDSIAMMEVRALIARASRAVATVMIRGESGTGKELVARALHESSARRDGPLVKIHCAALPETLLESELFGYEKGAFTGAVTTKAGRVELADGGTLFLDEVGDIPLPMQVKLLRLIQERQFERLGGRQTLHINVRFIVATHRPLEEMMARGEFREDLFYRLNVVPLCLPPLRDRGGDIAQLVRHFCTVHGKLNGRVSTTMDDDAIAVLERQLWPGNVRQLENFVERLVVLADTPHIGFDQVRAELDRQPLTVPPPSDNNRPINLGEQQRQSERVALTTALRQTGNNRTEAARLLGISRRTLYTKLAEHELL